MNVPKMIAVSALGLFAGVPLVASAAVPSGPGAAAAAPNHAIAAHAAPGHVVADDDFGPGSVLGPSGVGSP